MDDRLVAELERVADSLERKAQALITLATQTRNVLRDIERQKTQPPLFEDEEMGRLVAFRQGSGR